MLAYDIELRAGYVYAALGGEWHEARVSDPLGRPVAARWLLLSNRKAVVEAAASISPMSIDPESPMKILAGWKLCGRKPRQTPARTTEITAGG